MYYVTFSLTTIQNVCLCASHTHSVSRLCKPSKHLGSMLWIWLLWRCLGKKKPQICFFFWQIRYYLIKSFPNRLQFPNHVAVFFFFFFLRYRPKQTQSKTSLTGQRGQRGWRRHSLECVWSGWGPASWPEGTVRSRVPPLGFLLRSCHPTTGALESKLLWRPKPEPQTAG